MRLRTPTEPTGCRDSSRLPSEEARTLEAIRAYRLMLRPRLGALFARSTGDLLWAAARRRPRATAFEDARWPAHLHINLVPEARGTGAAENLMTAWFDRLRSTGCHLQNGSARLVPGLRYRVRRLHQRTLIRPPEGPRRHCRPSPRHRGTATMGPRRIRSSRHRPLL
ncbi:hypothetical protein [Actinomadura sp. NTSP31]|uniref:hypothetical protein n=1 Tax=Actinomadura sp. NTSP31 TaxID=1735447 RepID=UPI0035C23489